MKLGVCYYPEHWPESMWAQDAAEMKSIGLSLVRIGEFSWSKLEPEEDKFNFAWLDKAIDTLYNEGLKIILGTPSATPPRWVLDKFPDLLAYDVEGRPRTFGSRRHYCFSHEGYKQLAASMSARLAQRYGEHPALFAWQTDNEYGCHDTTRSYSPLARNSFQAWLKEKYKSITELNRRWGNIFWSMEYNNFEQIDLPNLSVTESNPAHTLDFYRFSSDQVVSWNQAQLLALREYTSKPIFHNYMGRITDFDHFKLGKDMEMATWDSYPLGFLEDRSDRSEAFKQKYQYTGDPDFQAFHHDLYRGVGKGHWGIMEQQPGPVNWAPHNPAPAKGMVRIWTLEAMAHGAEFVAYFRWRQLPFAQEQMHSALKRPDNRPTELMQEIQLLSKEIVEYKNRVGSKSKVAIVFDYESQWAWEVQAQGQDFDYFRLIYEFYCGLRKLGQDVDIIAPESKDINAYKLVIIPGQFSMSEKFIKELSSFKGELLIGPRSNTKSTDFHIHADSVSALMQMFIKIDEVETLRPSEKRKFDQAGSFVRWIEKIQVDGKTVGPIIKKENKTYVGAWPDENTMLAILVDSLDRAGLKHQMLQAASRMRSNYKIDYGNDIFKEA